jgi:hypothetical protein
MFDDIEEINKLVTDKEAEFDQLRSRMDDDFDLLTLLEYEPKDAAGNTRKGYEKYTSSAPRNIFDKVLDGLNQAALSIQIKLQDNANEKDRKAATNGELYLFGALHEINRRLTRQGEPPLREGLGHYMCNRGMWGLKCVVYVPKGQKNLIFDVQPWDPMNMTWEMGPDGLIWAALRVMRSKAQILSEYKYTIQGKEAEVTDFWDEEGNSVLIGSSEWGKSPTKHNIGHVPVAVGVIGSMPTMQGRTASGDRTNATGTTNASNEGGAIQYRGDSVWTASRGIYGPRNSQISTLMDLAKRASVGSLVHTSPDGNKIIEGDPHGTFKIIPLITGETLAPLESPRAPPETGLILELMDQDLQQSTLPYPLAYGGTQQALSGRALAFLSDRTRSVFSPRTGAMSIAYTWLSEELLGQFAKKGFKSTEVRGYNPLKNNEFFQVTIEPKDLKPSWFVEVKVEPRLPRDEETEIQMALAGTARRGPEDIPLISKRTARENILQIRDPDAEEARVLEEIGKALPPIMAARIAAATKAAGDDEGAELITAWMQSQGMMSGGQPPTGPPGAPGPGVPPQPGPPGAPGVPPGPAGPPGQEEPPEVQVIKVVLQKLAEIGAQQLAEPLVQALQGGQPIPPDLLAAILQALDGAGEQQLAQAFFEVMQAGGQ